MPASENRNPVEQILQSPEVKSPTVGTAPVRRDISCRVTKLVIETQPKTDTYPYHMSPGAYPLAQSRHLYQ